MDGEVEQIVAGMVGVCPWMTEEDVRVVREVVSIHLGLVVGRVVDLGRMAGLLLWLAERADAMGDVRRSWVFDQWYTWACESIRGKEYHWPEFPQALEALP